MPEVQRQEIVDVYKELQVVWCYGTPQSEALDNEDLAAQKTRSDVCVVA